MSLRDNLERYNTDKVEDCNILEQIYKNVSKSFFPGAKNLYKINSIIQAFNELDCVLWKFKNECKIDFNNIKKYILGCKFDNQETEKIEFIMKNWALFFPGIGIEPTIKDKLIYRYRKEFTVEFINKNKKQYNPLIYAQYLLFVKQLSISNHEEQVATLESLKNKNEKLTEVFLNYLTEKSHVILFENKSVNINENYIEKLKNDEFLLKTIKDIFIEKFKEDNYNNYEYDLKKIYLIQGSTECWVDINKLKNLITDKNLSLLKYAYLISEINEEDKHIIQLTELAFCIANNNFIKNWTSDKYVLECDDVALIPFDYNPSIINKYIFDKNYILKEKDFLFKFQRIIK